MHYKCDWKSYLDILLMLDSWTMLTLVNMLISLSCFAEALLIV